MKKIFKSTIVIVLCALFFISLFKLFRFGQVVTNAEQFPQGRTRTTKCTATDIENGILTLESADGMLWEWEIEKGEHFQKYQVYNVTFDTLGTPGLRDDIILTIK